MQWTKESVVKVSVYFMLLDILVNLAMTLYFWSMRVDLTNTISLRLLLFFPASLWALLTIVTTAKALFFYMLMKIKIVSDHPKWFAVAVFVTASIPYVWMRIVYDTFFNG
jgi:hypothetical protein